VWAAERSTVPFEDGLDRIELDDDDGVCRDVIVGVSVDNGVVEDLDRDGVVESFSERNRGRPANEPLQLGVAPRVCDGRRHRDYRCFRDV